MTPWNRNTSCITAPLDECNAAHDTVIHRNINQFHSRELSLDNDLCHYITDRNTFHNQLALKVIIVAQSTAQQLYLCQNMKND